MAEYCEVEVIVVVQKNVRILACKHRACSSKAKCEWPFTAILLVEKNRSIENQHYYRGYHPSESNGSLVQPFDAWAEHNVLLCVRGLRDLAVPPVAL